MDNFDDGSFLGLWRSPDFIAGLSIGLAAGILAAVLIGGAL